MTRLASASGVVVLSWLALLLGAGCSKSDQAGGAQKAPTSPGLAASMAQAASDAPLKSCVECEAASACVELKEGCSKFKGDDAKACEAVKECVQRTGCGQGDRTFTSCYCGELKTGDCLAAPLQGNGAPTGPCREPIAHAYGAIKNNTEVLTRYMEAEYPGSGAISRLNCLKLNCQRECSFDKAGPVPPSSAVPK